MRRLRTKVRVNTIQRNRVKVTGSGLEVLFAFGLDSSRDGLVAERARNEVALVDGEDFGRRHVPVRLNRVATRSHIRNVDCVLK